jgi:hypothetical protein
MSVKTDTDTEILVETDIDTKILVETDTKISVETETDNETLKIASLQHYHYCNHT